MEDDEPVRRRGRGRPSNAERERMRRYQERLQQNQDGGPSLEPTSRRRVIPDEQNSQDDSQQISSSRQTRARLR